MPGGVPRRAGPGHVRGFATAVPTASAATVVNSYAGTGIATAEAFGAAKLASALPGGGLGSPEAFGVGKLSGSRSAAGLGSAQAVGFAKLASAENAVGIASAQAFGTARLSGSRTGSGIASVAAVGFARLASSERAVGIPSGEAFGVGHVSASVVVVTHTATGIPSAEAFGAGARVSTLRVVPYVEPSGGVMDESGHHRSPVSHPVPRRARGALVASGLHFATGIGSGETLGMARRVRRLGAVAADVPPVPVSVLSRAEPMLAAHVAAEEPDVLALLLALV